MNYKNDYYNKTDYYNYVNNNYNQPVYSQEPKPTLYDPYQGFIRGNMFPSLFNGYKLNKPLDIDPLNEQARLLTYIDLYNFAMTDLNLFLDIYPNDKKMIELFSQYRAEYNRVVNEYESKYGPLTINCDASANYPWMWDNRPWPWEKE